MLSRVLTVLAAILLVSCAARSSLAVQDEIYVTGELLSVGKRPGCGGISTGTPAIYRVIDGPRELRGTTINVVIACIEMPLIEGDLRQFVIGTRHYLIISRKNVFRLDMPSSLPDKAWFYLKAASMQELRPNNSFKPSPLRGLGQNPPFSGGPA